MKKIFNVIETIFIGLFYTLLCLGILIVIVTLMSYDRFILIPIKNTKAKKDGYTICKKCFGNGFVDNFLSEESFTCSKCNGKGKIYWTERILRGEK